MNVIILYSLKISLHNEIYEYFNTTTNIRSKKYLHKTEWEQNKSFSKKGIMTKTKMSINEDEMSINEEKKAEKAEIKNVQNDEKVICDYNFFQSARDLFENISWEDWTMSEIETHVVENIKSGSVILQDFINSRMYIREEPSTSVVNNLITDKNSQFYCVSCNFYCDYESKMKRHYVTKRHLHNTKKEQESTAIVKTKDPPISNADMVNALIKQNQEFKEMIMELTNSSTGVTNNTINGNMNNNKFNINIFLNENCNQAINFTEFIEKIDVSQDDLENNAQLGFVNGISKIILDNLRQLSMHERPIHCTDVKRETMYIKDENTWQREEDGDKIKKGIQEVSRKSMKTLNEWKEQNPDYNDMDSEFSNKCITMQQQSNAGSKRDLYYPKIVKTVAKETTIDKTNSHLIKLSEDKTVRS